MPIVFVTALKAVRNSRAAWRHSMEQSRMWYKQSLMYISVITLFMFSIRKCNFWKTYIMHTPCFAFTTVISSNNSY